MMQPKRFSTLVICFAILVIVFSSLFTIAIVPTPFARSLSTKYFPHDNSASDDSSTLTQYDQLVAQVAPPSGKTVLVEWGDMGQQLVAAGAIDIDKFTSHYGQLTPEQQAILTGDGLHQITFTPDNIQFWTNVLWALGLTQKSTVLDEGPMMTRADQVPVANYAGTAGWTLGSKDAMDLYSSTNLINLTPQQHALVMAISENIYRPCCGNPTSYPDCNHGMAVLGLLELMVSQGASEQEMYQAALAFNSYAFTNSYVTAAAYLQQQGSSWSATSAKDILSATYSSGQAAATIAQQVGEIPGAPQRGASCGA